MSTLRQMLLAEYLQQNYGRFVSDKCNYGPENCKLNYNRLISDLRHKAYSRFAADFQQIPAIVVRKSARMLAAELRQTGDRNCATYVVRFIIIAIQNDYIYQFSAK